MSLELLRIIFWAIVVICDVLIMVLLILQRRSLNRAEKILKEKKYEKDPDFIDLDLDGILKHQHSESIDTEPRVYRDHAGRLRFNSDGLLDPAYVDQNNYGLRGTNWAWGGGNVYYADRTTRNDGPRDYTDGTSDN